MLKLFLIASNPLISFTHPSIENINGDLQLTIHTFRSKPTPSSLRKTPSFAVITFVL